MDIATRLAALRERMDRAARAAGRDPGEIALCAATKTQSDETIRQAIACGVTLCGENRAQELAAHRKGGAYAGAQVHFIGRLQTNKVKEVVGNVSLIHCVDTPRLLRAIDTRAGQLGLVQDILLQVNIAHEATKGGCPPEEVLALAQLAGQSPNVRLRGLMAIPPLTDDPQGNKPYFTSLYQLFIDIKEKLSHNQGDINCLSMGMTGDFECAIACGATIIRVGTALFGPRGAGG